MFSGRGSNLGSVERVFPFSHSDKSKPSIVVCSQIPNFAAGHLQALQHKPSRQVAVVGLCYWFWPVSVGSLLLVYHNYMNALAIEGSQIIAFLAYQSLTLPPGGLKNGHIRYPSYGGTQKNKEEDPPSTV